MHTTIPNQGRHLPQALSAPQQQTHHAGRDAAKEQTLEEEGTADSDTDMAEEATLRPAADDSFVADFLSRASLTAGTHSFFFKLIVCIYSPSV